MTAKLSILFAALCAIAFFLLAGAILNGYSMTRGGQAMAATLLGLAAIGETVQELRKL
jgi:hypothetical protein